MEDWKKLKEEARSAFRYATQPSTDSKKRQEKLEEALRLYKKASVAAPKDPSLLNNQSACLHLLQRGGEEILELSDKALRLAKAQRDIGAQARAWERKAKALHGMGEKSLEKAVEALSNSLLERPSEELAKLRQQWRKELADHLKKKYRDVKKSAALAAQAAALLKDKHGKSGDAKAAAQAKCLLDRAILHRPEKQSLYLSRAEASYLQGFLEEAVLDCRHAIHINADYREAYLRLSQILTELNEYTQATKALEDAVRRFPADKDVQDSLMELMQRNQGNPLESERRALERPEVQAILSDAGFRSILDDCTKDAPHGPINLERHLKDPETARKISLLLHTGVVGLV